LQAGKDFADAEAVNRPLTGQRKNVPFHDTTVLNRNGGWRDQRVEGTTVVVPVPV
jgi:hypothetical protein